LKENAEENVIRNDSNILEKIKIFVIIFMIGPTAAVLYM
jgi:hypothetical protein